MSPGDVARPTEPIRQETAHDPVVYYATSIYGGCIKIGTTVRLRQRLGRLARTAGRVPIVLLAMEPGDETVERVRLVELGVPSFRQGGEWCWPTPELLAHIDRLAAGHTS